MNKLPNLNDNSFFFLFSLNLSPPASAHKHTHNLNGKRQEFVSMLDAAEWFWRLLR